MAATTGTMAALAFEKNFYMEHPDVAAWRESDVRLRLELKTAPAHRSAVFHCVHHCLHWPPILGPSCIPPSQAEDWRRENRIRVRDRRAPKPGGPQLELARYNRFSV